MFQGKVYSYQNINGKEKTFEKSFDNYDEYQNFINSDPSFFENISLPNFGFSGLSDFNQYLDDFIHSRSRLSQGGESPTNEDMSDLPVDITRYESEAQRIAQEDAEREKKKSRLQKAREKLQEYLDKFQTRENQDDSVKKLIQDAQADMKKIDEELNKLG